MFFFPSQTARPLFAVGEVYSTEFDEKYLVEDPADEMLSHIPAGGSCTWRGFVFCFFWPDMFGKTCVVVAVLLAFLGDVSFLMALDLGIEQFFVCALRWFVGARSL